MATPKFLRSFTATPLQIATYLLGVALFSISFLVFLNSSVSFVITDLIGLKHGVGDAVGTLGFADELVALVACPVWGVASDRLGVRAVCVIGYAILGLSLCLFVQAKNVYPQLLLARLLFSVGGAATATMVTAILPTMTDHSSSHHQADGGTPGNKHATSPSVSSEITITPARFTWQSPPPYAETEPSQMPSRPQEALVDTSASSTSQLAGLVGMFTGFGALLALGVFLPLPARFQKAGISPPAAVADSFYIVGATAIVVSLFCFIGLRKLPGEERKGIQALLGRHPKKLSSASSPDNAKTKNHTYANLLLSALALGFTDVDVGLAYLGGFVARASSVGISLFIPLFVNAYFISSGLCPDSGNSNNEDIKRNCRRAYSLAAALTGVSQLVALLCAPAFGYLSGRYPRGNVPLLVAALAGIVGYVAFGLVKNPDPSSEGGSGVIFVVVALLGISQIGAIVGSLGLLGQGVQRSADRTGSDLKAEPPVSGDEEDRVDGQGSANSPSAIADTTPRHPVPKANHDNGAETTPLLASTASTATLPASPLPPSHSSRTHFKGSIAGVYSLAGGAGILLLTKLGGYLFDAAGPGSPFFILAAFNAMLFLFGLGVGVLAELRRRGTKSASELGSTGVMEQAGREEQ